MIPRVILIAILSLMLMGLDAFADPASEAFNEANALTMQGKAEAALDLYEKALARVPRDPDLLYNAGTANLMAGKLGVAVLYLERALALDPDCSDCKHNLSRAMEQQADKVIVQSTENQVEGKGVDALLEGMSLDGLAVFLLVLHLPLVFLVIIRRFVKAERGRFGLVLAIAILLMIELTIGSLMLFKVTNYEVREYAVVQKESVVVRKGPNINYPQSFTIHEGLKVRLGEPVEDWQQIWLANGLNGYIPLSAIEKI